MTNVSDVSRVLELLKLDFLSLLDGKDYSPPELILNEIPASILDNSQPFDGQNYDV